jgi:hypothetical protein
VVQGFGICIILQEHSLLTNKGLHLSLELALSQRLDAERAAREHDGAQIRNQIVRLQGGAIRGHS